MLIQSLTWLLWKTFFVIDKNPFDKSNFTSDLSNNYFGGWTIDSIQYTTYSKYIAAYVRYK